MFIADVNNCFEATVYEAENLLLAERYWKNCSNKDGVPPIKEILASGHIEVIKILKEINANV